MKPLRDEILKRLHLLESRPGMIIYHPSYITGISPLQSYLSGVNFIQGYLWGLESTMGINLTQLFRKWVLHKTGKSSSQDWQGHIYHFVANEDADLTLQLSIGYLKEFIEENADSLFKGNETAE